MTLLSDEIQTRYIGGPTLLLEAGGWRLLTDPTFDGPGTDYQTPLYTLHKSGRPRVDREALGRIDVVLLSHDHHFDNLDHTGRALLGQVDRVLTTPAGAGRIGPWASGLEPWQKIALPERAGKVLEITGTPCRHGPAGSDRGPVTGFLLQYQGAQDGAVYISGDTVWYEGVEEVARRYRPGLVVLFMGAARVKEVGPDHLTMTAEEGVTAARHFPGARVMPLHFEDWAHFTESRREIDAAFRKAGLSDRLAWPS